MSFHSRTCVLAVAILCLLVAFGLAQAQTKSPAPPAGMTQQQYDDLVKAVGQSVLETLEKKGLITKLPGPVAGPKLVAVKDEELIAGRIVEALRKVPDTLGGYADVGMDLAQVPGRLDRTPAGGRSLSDYLALLALVSVAGYLAEFVVGLLTAKARTAIAQQFTTQGGLWRVAAIAGLDGIAFVALWMVAHLSLATWFSAAEGQTMFASTILNGLVAWRLYLLLFRFFLRPGLPAARIAAVTDDGALRLYWLFGLAVLTVVVGRAWISILVTPSVISAAVFTNSFIAVGILVFIILRARKDVSAWLLELIGADAGKKRLRAALARNWHIIGILVVIVLGLARAYEALSEHFEVPLGAILTLNIIVGLLLVETLLSFVDRRHRASILAAPDQPEASRIYPFAVRAIRATILVEATALMIHTWTVDVLDIVNQESWDKFSGAWTTSVITALVAYYAWEAVHFATERRVSGPKVTTPGEESDSENTQFSATRLETLAPLLRILLGIVIITTATMMILTDLGINITPFIAGASVVGLAISFGSQTLVHDIVSGLFYLADDAFRVGEYIDCGKAKGTVEGFTLRSIRLRHQNGQIHTIPFGQLGQITNFSRDWTTLKFNLRLARNTDLEKLRKVTKKVGLAMFEDPEMKGDFLEPLKLQGVADIDDTATIMRFKTTVLPIRPSYIQREAVKRLMAAFKDAGLEFASATTVVSTVGGGPMGVPAATPTASTPTTKPS